MFQASSQDEKESILEDCVVEQLTFVEGVVVATENMTSGLTSEYVLLKCQRNWVGVLATLMDQCVHKE